MTDLFLFAVILVAFELILHYALIAFEGDFTFSPLVPIVLLVMMRWGWPSVFFAVGDGILYCALNGGGIQSYVTYGVGNAFIMLLLLMTKFMGKERIRGRWYFSVIFAIAGWLSVALGRGLIAGCFNGNFAADIISQLADLISLAVAIIIILIMRRFDGMFEDQKHYLLRLDEERKERSRRDAFGEDPLEIDEESMSVLKKWDDAD